ncbi:hypothetical protein PM082_007323 [Marasmius tenuissimus]|nr:hypothetical protein PM082_007323 [Marasmius tenuissimus]
MSSTRSGDIKGSTRWMAPEMYSLATGDVEEEARVSRAESEDKTLRDIYAFACTVLEIMTGKPPFHHLIDPAVIYQVSVHHIRPTRPSEGWCPDHIWDLVESCWSEDPLRRPRAKALQRYLQMLIEAGNPSPGDPYFIGYLMPDDLDSPPPVSALEVPAGPLRPLKVSSFRNEEDVVYSLQALSTIVLNTIHEALQRTATGESKEYLHTISSLSISFHNTAKALLSYFPRFHAKDQLITLVETVCSTTYLLRLVLNKPEVTSAKLTNGYEMMNTQISRALHGDRLSRTLSEAVAFVNELRAEGYYDKTRTSSCLVTCNLPGTLDSCVDKIGIFQSKIASFVWGLKLSSDPVQIVESISSLPGFTFILSGNNVLLWIAQLVQNYRSMHELARSSEVHMWNVCLYARGISQVASQMTHSNNGNDLAQTLVRSILRYKRIGNWENHDEIVRTSNGLAPQHYPGWHRGLPSGFSPESVLHSVQSLRAYLANQ